MKCPTCGDVDDRVIDSRLAKDNTVIRRRRQCLTCKKRFTTYEKIEEIVLYVIKKDGRRDIFDRRKLVEGMRRACEKRPVSRNAIERVADSIEQQLSECPDNEVSASHVGEQVMEELRKLDDVAYVRFASVYRSFRDIEEFVHEIKGLYERKEARERGRNESELPEERPGFQDSP